MEYSISAYNDDSPMKPWPSLAEKAFRLTRDDLPGDSVFYFDSPPGGPAAGVFILIHGLGDDADSWRHLIPLLNLKGWRVLALDLPGFARSVASEKVSIEKHAAAVIQLIEAVAGHPSTPATPIFLAGNSIGALVAEFVAIKRPELVHSLILIDGSIPGGPSKPNPIGLFKLLFSRKWYGNYRDNHERARNSLYPYFADFDAMPLEDREFLRQRVIARVESTTQEKAFFATQSSLIWAYARVSWYARRIRKFKGKIQLIWGEKDRIIPRSSMFAFRKLRTDTEMAVIPGAGHLPHQEKPEETVKIMMEFVEKCRNEWFI